MTNGLPFSVLLVDDDEDDRMIMNDAFLEIGFGAEIKKFINVRSLLHYLEVTDAALYPSLIVLDNTLPEMDAKAALLLLKGNPAYESIPVVIYSSSLTSAKKESLLAAGAHACFLKGNTMQEIIVLARQLHQLSVELSGRRSA